jgi:hypothetical protein
MQMACIEDPALGARQSRAVDAGQGTGPSSHPPVRSAVQNRSLKQVMQFTLAITEAGRVPTRSK